MAVSFFFLRVDIILLAFIKSTLTFSATGFFEKGLLKNVAALSIIPNISPLFVTFIPELCPFPDEPFPELLVLPVPPELPELPVPPEPSVLDIPAAILRLASIELSIDVMEEMLEENCSPYFEITEDIDTLLACHTVFISVLSLAPTAPASSEIVLTIADS